MKKKDVDAPRWSATAMAHPFSIDLSRDLVESGWVNSVTVRFNGQPTGAIRDEAGAATTAQEQTLLVPDSTAIPPSQSKGSSANMEGTREGEVDVRASGWSLMPVQ